MSALSPRTITTQPAIMVEPSSNKTDMLHSTNQSQSRVLSNSSSEGSMKASSSARRESEARLNPPVQVAQIERKAQKKKMYSQLASVNKEAGLLKTFLNFTLPYAQFGNICSCGLVYLVISVLLLPTVLCDRLECDSLLRESLSSSNLIVKASLVSRSTPRDGGYLATFRIQKILFADSEIESKYLRLQISQQSTQQEGVCRASTKVKPRTTYLLFVKQLDDTQAGLFASQDEFSLISSPIKVTRHLLRNVRNMINQTSGKESKPGPTNKRRHLRHHREIATQIRRLTSNNSKNQRFTCSARGNPPPTLYWTVDGLVVKSSDKARISNKKISTYLRKSILRLRGPLEENTYLQCHAVNSHGRDSRVKPVLNLGASSGGLHVTKTSTSVPPPEMEKQSVLPPDFTAASFNPEKLSVGGKLQGFRGVKQFRKSPLSHSRGLKNPLESSGCPVENYCMNGGTCHYYSNIGELTCHCSKGFQGRRCERKYVSTTSALNGPKMSEKVPLCSFGIGQYPCQ